MRLTYVTLFVRDVRPVRDWYVRFLDLQPATESDAFVLLTGTGGAALGIHQGEPLSEPGRVNLHFEVPDVDAAAARLQEQGLELSAGPRDMPWGHRVLTLTDPAGHTVEVYSPQRAGPAGP